MVTSGHPFSVRLQRALAALLLAGVAQWCLPHVPLGGLILFGAAALLFLSATTHPEQPWPDTSLKPIPPLTGRRYPLLALLLSLGAILSAAGGLYLFSRETQLPWAWRLYLSSLLLGLGAVYAAFPGHRQPSDPAARRTAWRTGILTLYVVLIGAALRFYRLDVLPWGVWHDEAGNGLVALRLMSDPTAWPVYVPSATLPAHFLYLVALSFRVLRPSPLALRIVSACFGLLTIVAAYGVGRELFGRGAGLILAVFLAFSRWDINWSRIGMQGVTTPFFTMAVVYFLARGLRTGHPRFFAWAGLSLGLGMSSYAAFRPFPVVVCLFLLSLAVRQGRNWFLPRYASGLVILIIMALLTVAPVGQYALTHGDVFWHRTWKVSVFTELADASPSVLAKALADNIIKHLGMLNYRGDPNGRHNLPGLPMLDPISRVLFPLGLVSSLRRWREPRYLLLILWWAVMLGNGIFTLTFEAPQSFRAIGAMPAIYLMVCLPLLFLYRLWKHLGGLTDHQKQIIAVAVAGLALLYAGWYDAHTYFCRQMRDPRVWGSFSPAQTWVAHQTEALARDYDLYVSPALHTPTTLFLLHNLIRYTVYDPHKLLPIPTLRPGKHGAIVFADPDTNVHLWERVRRYYPRSYREPLTSPYGGPPVAYAYHISQEDIYALHGLQASFYNPGNLDTPVLRYMHEELDFDQFSPPGLSLPSLVQWAGALAVPRYGTYVLGFQAHGSVTVQIDDTPVLSSTAPCSTTVALAEGLHALCIRAFITSPGPVRFLWQPPQAARLAPIPSTYLYRTPVTASGLIGHYYANDHWAEPVAFMSMDSAISFRFLQPPLPRPYTAEWNGRLEIPYSGTYTFELETNGSAWLYLDGRLLVHSTDTEAPAQATITLAAGLHPLRVRFLDTTAFSYVHLYWTPPGGSREIIPREQFRPPR